MASKVDLRKVSRAFYKSAEFKQIVRIGAAVFDPRLSGGFARVVAARQGEWPDLNAHYRAWKERKGLGNRKWVRTGKTLAALSQGPLPRKEGTRKGVHYYITPGRLWAIIRPMVFASKVPGQKRRAKAKKVKAAPLTKEERAKKAEAKNELQKKIFRNLNYGIDKHRKAKAIRSKSRRILNGFPARSLFAWMKMDEAPVEKAIAKEAQAIFREAGFR